jgi:hypothetical protein
MGLNDIHCWSGFLIVVFGAVDGCDEVVEFKLKLFTNLSDFCVFLQGNFISLHKKFKPMISEFKK